MIREHASCLFRSPPIEVCGDAPAAIATNPAVYYSVIMAVVIVGLIAIVCAAGARPR